ncbi:MAG: tRNA 2-thiouridine(34) synthase MnmA [Alphaproteobacteria bacterium]|nr:MAG: tRNA 2-thiouridine(34) synthase MnmA [Alphaproteobacteria bacterium]
MRSFPKISLDNIPANSRVAVAMSGGVDSSVAASLLSLSGYEVIGITLQLYDQGEVAKTRKACCAGQDIYDAKMVAEKIGFAHYVLDYESVFKEQVIDNFVDSYLRGETPIPCVQCNQKVKFLDLFKAAKDLGCAGLATGHYIRRIVKPTHVELHKAIDITKDQSYFLFSTTPEQLDFIHFPLGGYDKNYTRQLAEQLELNIAQKPDSQDICFVPGGDYREVVRKLSPHSANPGDIVHINGQKLGQHNGIVNFTIGQRKGLGVSYHEPLYVVKLHPENNTVVVGSKEHLKTKFIYVNDVNWLLEKKNFIAPYKGEVKIRSTQTSIPATIQMIDDKQALVEILTDEYGVSKGQACVFYDGTHVLGGGWIVDAS